MYVCQHVGVCVYLYVYVYVCVRILLTIMGHYWCVNVRKIVCMSECVRDPVCMCLYVCVCVRVCVYACTHVLVCESMHSRYIWVSFGMYGSLLVYMGLF